MHHDQLGKTESQGLVSLLNSAQQFYVRIRQIPNQNDTIGISTVENNDDDDQPEPLRTHEIILVICVLLIWCASILVFIRHSQLLRIRYRDIPYYSPAKNSVNLNQTVLSSRTSDAAIRSKSCVSSTGGITPPIGRLIMNGYRHGEAIETVSLSISPSSKKRRHPPSLDMTMSLMTKHSFDKHNDKEQLLHPHRISADVKDGLLELHRKSIGNLHRKSMDNLSSIKYSTFYSANDITNRQPNHTEDLTTKKRGIQESPV
ncbi:unnamed protein product [Adineta steineri]|uniref:Fibronectin type III domain-containing protein n=1 Tax=Adineta steineri TaxID=433720 RepID=A0A819BT99_9BILA|nr:unnamed protein product [Adineta steineri]CAF3803302.1 unnamed protein product [Adineta steineri]